MEKEERKSYPNIVIIFTDGEINPVQEQEIMQEAKRLRHLSIHYIVVGEYSNIIISNSNWTIF